MCMRQKYVSWGKYFIKYIKETPQQDSSCLSKTKLESEVILKTSWKKYNKIKTNFWMWIQLNNDYIEKIWC